MSFEQLFASMQQQYCKKCDVIRKEVNYEDLKEPMKSAFKEIYTGKEKFLHCERCNETSISFPTIAFGLK